MGGTDSSTASLAIPSLIGPGATPNLQSEDDQEKNQLPRDIRALDIGDGKGIQDVIMVSWHGADPENPQNWSSVRKGLILLSACLLTASTSVNSTSPAIIATWGLDWFNVSRAAFGICQTLFMVGIAYTPMCLAPLSEQLGRNVIYQVTSVITTLLFLPQFLTKSYAALLVCRLLQGMSSSVGNSMVGGTIADLYAPKNRGIAMNMFAVSALGGGGLGNVLTGWVGMAGGFQWTLAYQAIIALGVVLFNIVFLRETRADVLLSRRAKRLTKQTGQLHLSTKDLQEVHFWQSLRATLIRPFVFLATEPIVAALSAWIGFAWICLFTSAQSTLLVFSSYGWNVGQLGTVQITVVMGALIGFGTNYHQEYLYRRKARQCGGRAPPEARLYYAAYGGLCFPLGLFVFAWTGQPQIHWIAPAIALVISNWGLYCMYVGVFNYLADAYETYSSSAQAAHSCVRNTGGAIVPFFAFRIYDSLGYSIATTVVASLALVLGAAPIALLRYGHVLRKRSKIASTLASS